MPRTPTNLIALRERFGEILGEQKSQYTDARIPDVLSSLGLADYEGSTSKREHFRGAVEAATDAELVSAAGAALELLRLPIAHREELQELFWDDGSRPVIPMRFRRELAQRLDKEALFVDGAGFLETIAEFWRIDEYTMLFLTSGPDLREQIEQHCIRNDDWGASILFDQLGAYKSSDARFARFIEALASSVVRPDEAVQRTFMAAVDEALKPCGVHFVASFGVDAYLEGYLAYTGGGAKNAPKNLIFASTAKPDLRLSDALENDVEVVSNPEQVLMYDRPIGPAGLRWCDLQAWFEGSQGLSQGEGKLSLYRRLLGCLPKSSPPQRLAFTSYYSAFAKDQIPDLPVLLPEVWFHWDPQTVSQRGKAALLRSRIDFLLLLPRGIRVVIEVDGQHHYATADGQASPSAYSAMMYADRSLRLAGYEVYRFGGHELSLPNAQTELVSFYRSLFKRYGLIDNN
ncbi:hypothetical protein D3C81_531430 [compost metagenome]